MDLVEEKQDNTVISDQLSNHGANSKISDSDSDTYDKLMSLFSSNPERMPEESAQNDLSAESKAEKSDLNPLAEKNGIRLSATCDNEWGIRNYKYNEDTKEFSARNISSINVRDMMLSPSGASLLKYLTFIKIAPEAIGDISKSSADSKKKVKLNGVQIRSTMSAVEPSLMSFPVIVDVGDVQSKEDDIYISTLKFRSYAMQLVLQVKIFPP